MKITKLAAIDVGSNAIRLLINTIYDDGAQRTFNKTSLVRAPVRLGYDAFVSEYISEENQTRLIKSMKAFKLLMDVYQVQDYSAFATSAMREVRNGEEVVRKIKNLADIDLQLIDGETEGNIIFETELKSYVNDSKNYLYVDVGGGSTECTLLVQGEVKNSKSFAIGTVRWLHNKVSKDYLEKEVKPWIIKNCRKYENVELIGSGGNINYIFKISGKKVGNPLSLSYISKQLTNLKELSFEDRLRIYNMKTDRADVVIPALEIYVNIMKYAQSKKIHVPKIGLSDGMIQYMYHHNDY